MEIVFKEGIDGVDREEWNDFVMQHNKGSIFQTSYMYDAYMNTPNHKPIIIFAYVDGHLVGVLLAVILQTPGFLKNYFSKRSIILSGPIVLDDNKVILSEILAHYNKLIRTKVIYTQIRNQFEQLTNNDSFQKNHYKFSSHLNFLISLENPEAIWGRIGKGRIKQIKKAQKNGLYVDVYKGPQISDALIETGYSIITEVYEHAKLPLVDIQLIKNINKSGHLIMFVVRNTQGDIMGCRFGLSYKQSIYGWYAGSYSKYYKEFPNDMLIWQTLKWASENNYSVFDYGGAGEPNKPYGVRDFKSQMGGELVNFGRYELIHKKLLYQIAVLGYKFLRLIKR